MIGYSVRCVLLVLPALAIGTLAQDLPPGGSGKMAQQYRVHAAVEEKASLLQENDQDTYRALADEIFKAPRGYEIMTAVHGIGPTKIPPSIDYIIKDRLSWAEMQYRRGVGKGVKEQSIVNLTNLLAEKFGLPDYTRTSQKQVRSLRMFLMVHNPRFMGEGVVRPDMQVGESINEEMSPLQAVHVLLEVWGHKFMDENFQIAPEQWDPEKALRATRKASQMAAQQSPTPKITGVVAVFSRNDKEPEVRSLLAQHVNSMSLVEGLALTEKAFEVLEIEK